MKIHTVLIACFLCLPLFVTGARAQPSDSASEALFQVGEDLIYNVSYASVNLGQVRVRLLEKKSTEGRTLYGAQANIDSYKGVPFVDLHTVYNDLFDRSVFSVWFRSKIREDHGWDTVYYTYDYPGKSVFIANQPGQGGARAQKDTLAIDSYYQDGLSLFFYARREVLKKQQVTVPTIVNEKLGTTSFNFLAERTDVEIDAVDYPVDVSYFRGEAGFVGIFGLTGEFEGWFSNDEARVPVLAKMKVLIGSVRIELMQWERDGWTPPKYENR